MIKCENLQKWVPMAGAQLEILKGITLEIKSGESVAIVGASGSGKSTLLGLLAGLDEATAGEVNIDGTDLGALDEDGRARFRARHVGFVFQSFQLLPALTALENVMIPLELRGGKNISAKAEHLLGRVGLEERKNHYPSQLSGGEQQRVAIARAFITDPKILFADEPTGNLDEETAEIITNLLFELNKEKGTTLVLVTHNPQLAAHTGRILKLKGGKLIEDKAVSV